MGVITLMFFVLALPVATLCSTDQWLHHIYVDNQTGVDDPSCWEGGYLTPCLSLNLALTGAQRYKYSTSIHLQPGQHQLYNGSETQLRNMSQLAIMGNGSEGEVVIICEPLAGLAFFWSQDIEINNVSLSGCGALQNSTSTNVGTPSAGFLQIIVALFFNGCSTINLTKLHVFESPGTGVVMYNSLGVVNIDKSQFLRNGFSDGKEVMYGGGGLVLDANEDISEISCTITNSTFTDNTASSGQFIYLSLTTSRDGYFGLGRGGGISVVFRGGAVNNTVQLDNVSLDSNTAQFGGGLFLGFLDNASNNKVHMDNSWLRENTALVDSGVTKLSDLTKGGGVSISLMAGASDSNAVVISNTNFVSNEAHTGGGIAVNVLHNSSYKHIGTGNNLLIDKCKFINNTGFQGASAYFSQNSNCGQTVLSTTVSCSSFNGGYCGGLSLMNGHRVYGLPCYSNVLLESFQMILEGTVMFNNNQLSALSLQSSSIELLPLTQSEFKDNNAFNGAAIYVVDCSSIIVNHNVALIFQNNSASNLGGAIYAESCHNSGVDSCFFRHTNSTLHPNYWEITVNFTDNKKCGYAVTCTNNSIYADSIGFCIWPDSLFSIHDYTHQTYAFCWAGWNYANMYGNDGCRNQLASGPAYVENTGPSNYTVYPGEHLSLENYSVYDSWDNDLTCNWQVSFEVDVVSGAGSANIVNNGQFQVLSDYGHDYVNKSILILVHPSQFPGVLINVSFKLCENGSTYDDEGGCIHECINTSSLLVCADPSSFCSTCYDDANMHTCGVYTSKGTEMCGSCAHSYGVAFNFPYFVCTKFSEWYRIILVLLEFVLVLLMMIILSVLHINITSGSMNGFILFSQLVSLDLPGLGSTAWVPSSINNTYLMNTKQFASVPLTFYSIWNLNFLTLVPTPFSIHNTSAAGVILLQYIKATCPLLFILVTYVWIRWYNNGYRFVVYTTRPVHQLLARFWQKFKIQPSLIDTYAGLMLLSYMQFLAVSVKIIYIFYLELSLPFTNIFNSVLLVLATVSLLVFVLPMMTILLFYHLTIFQKCLTWCKLDRPGLHALVDAYQGCFRNSVTDGSERRYFAGLSLFFRFLYLVAVAIVMIIISNLNISLEFFNPFSAILYIYISILPIEVCMGFVTAGIVVILRPYKKTSHNVIDFLILWFLTLIPTLSLLDITFLNYLPINYNYKDTLNLILFRNVIFLPLLILLFYLIYRLIKWCCTNMTCPSKCKTVHKPSPDGASLPEHAPLVTHHPTTTEVTLNDDYVQDDLYADRILNPGGYNKQHTIQQDS